MGWIGRLGLAYTLKVKVAQSCPTLCDPMGYIVPEILQARILEWVAFPFSRGSSQSRDRIQVSHIAGGFFTSWATRETLTFSAVLNGKNKISLVVQWLRIHLLVSVRDTSLIPFLGRCHMQLSPDALEAVLYSRESHCSGKPGHHN